MLSERTARRDLIVKRRLYADLRIPIVNRERRAIDELVLDPDGHHDERHIPAPGVFHPALFADLAIDLADLFA